MVDDIERLAEQIQMLKRELIFTAKAFGINSKETLCCSQKLDRLIIIHQKYGVRAK